MQIVIPMSGFGERFRRAGYAVPKPLIEVAGRPIISYVADLFPGETDIIFICNEDHLKEPKFRMREILKEIRPTGRIVGIPAHSKGPVYAVSLVADMIRDDEPVIVNYCDFTCYWDYEHFKRFTVETQCDGAIPSYRGFHPHSYGSTYYAYLREAGGWASNIQEKKPWTDTPIHEYASSGTYYFGSGVLMKHAFNEVIRRNIETNGEHYVSLAYIPLFEEGKRIAAYGLQHFMQWGTPDDLAEYLQHEKTFAYLANPENFRPAAHEGTLLLPMAGAGSRFAAEGYEKPKPLIPVSGRPMAVAAASDLPATEKQIFVLRRDLPHVEETDRAMREAFPGCKIVMLDKLTEGQAITCLEAMQGVDLDAPLTIGACDNGVLYDADGFNALMADESADVIVWGFRGHDAARKKPNSYGWIEAEKGRIKSVSVKTPLADPASDPVIIGTFTFRRARNFKAAVERMVARDGRINGEFYVDTCINDAVALGLDVRLFEVDAYLCWGTPLELKTFEYWQSCFHKWEGHAYTLSKDARVPLDAVDALEHRFAAIRSPLPAKGK